MARFQIKQAKKQNDNKTISWNVRRNRKAVAQDSEERNQNTPYIKRRIGICAAKHCSQLQIRFPKSTIDKNVKWQGPK